MRWLRPSPMERALTAENRRVHADLRAATARIVELNVTVCALAAENERIQAHLELAQVLAFDGLKRTIDDKFAEDVAAPPDFALYARSLHVYGASVVPPGPGMVTGL